MSLQRGGMLIHTGRGGRTELLGGFCYATIELTGAPMCMCDNTAVSLTVGESCFTRRHGSFDPLARETRGGDTRELRKADALPRTGGSMIPLYVGQAAK